MPELVITDVTQAALKFAAGDDRNRLQESSTWYARFTRGHELFVFNRDSGGNLAHISFHQDGKCHYKTVGSDGRRFKFAEWELPEPLEETGMRRLATVVIPHRGLVPPPGLVHPQPDTVLIPPPLTDQQLEIDILWEPGRVPAGAFPMQTAGLGTMFVGRFTLYDRTPEEGLAHFTLVATPRPEGSVARQLSTAEVRTTGSSLEMPEVPRAVHFEIVEVDGQKLPVLTEMPIGHLR
jgi:hypothetical protein